MDKRIASTAATAVLALGLFSSERQPGCRQHTQYSS